MDASLSRWSIFPAYLVRIAGFAYGRLAPLRCARAAEAEHQLATTAQIRAVIGRSYDEAFIHERYADNPMFDDPARRKAFSRHVKQTRAFARKLTDTAVPAAALDEIVRVLPGLTELARKLDQAHVVWINALRQYEAAFADDFEHARGALRALFHDERLQEAVFLESLEAYERIQQLIATTGPRNARARQRERLAAMYAQRFCAKNDTNSICGPHGVGYLSGPGSGPGGDAGTGGPTAIEIVQQDARRETYFSHWAAQRLLDEAVRRAGPDARITLRTHPAARLDGNTASWFTMDQDGSMSRRRHARSELPEAGVQLLRALARPHDQAELAQLAQELGIDDDELTPFIDQLVTAGVVLRGPILPTGLFRPLRTVAAELERWPASDTRSWALGEVTALEALVERFARAPLAERLTVFQQIAARFESATGNAATRGEGQHYADRSVLHEDCYVDVRSEFGPARQTLASALPIVISVLELSVELGRERVREWFRARYGEGVRVSALDVHRAFDDDRVLDTPAATPRAAALRTAVERVREAIARAVATCGDGPARLTAGDLRHALAEVPAPTHAGYVSADVMLRRLPSNAIELVLAEVHGFFWLPTCLLDVLPPDHRERVVGHMRAAMREMARGQPTAECMFTHTQATDRRFPLATTDLQIVVPSDRPDAVDFSALDVQLTGDELIFTRNGEEIVPLVAYNRYAFFHNTSKVAPLFDDQMDRFFPDSLLPDSVRDQDAPRLMLDDVVFQRRQWRRPAAVIRAALAADTEVELFRRAQDLRRELGCDARVFVSVSGEPKPLMLDFENVFLLEALSNMLDRQPDSVVKLSEMLPGPDELVSRGPDGDRTAEIRLGFYRT